MYFEEAARLEKDDSDGDAALRGRSGPTPLQGTRTDDELSPAARDAVQVALRALSPHAAHPRVAGVLGPLQSVADSDRGERFTGDDDDSTLADELAKCEGTRTAIAKGEIHASDDMRERLDKAHAELTRSYLAKHSQGFQRAQEARQSELGQRRSPLVI